MVKIPTTGYQIFYNQYSPLCIAKKIPPSDRNDRKHKDARCVFTSLSRSEREVSQRSVAG